jgi:hypothetical protein
MEFSENLCSAKTLRRKSLVLLEPMTLVAARKLHFQEGALRRVERRSKEKT